MPTLRDIVVGVAFYIDLRGPGIVPGFSPWSSPIPPLYPTQSMSAVTLSLSSILPLRLVPCLPTGAVAMFIVGLAECAPSNGVCCVRWFVVDTVPRFHRLVATLVVFRYLASASAPMLVQRRRSRRSLGILGVSLRIITRALACCWHLRMICAGVCGGAPLQLQ